MSKYKKQDVTGKKYQKYGMAVIENREGKVPAITFEEETVISIGDEVVAQPVKTILRLQLSDEASILQFDLLDSETGEKLGVSTGKDAQDIIYSLYMHMAQARDEERKQPIIQFEEEPTNKTATLGSSIEFFVKATADKGHITYTWSELNGTVWLPVSILDIFRIENVKQSDSGRTFKVTATATKHGKYGIGTSSITSNTFTLSVE